MAQTASGVARMPAVLVNSRKEGSWSAKETEVATAIQQTNQATAALEPPSMIATGIQQPIMRPIFRCLPDRVSGIPSCLDNRPFAAESPIARFHYHERPNFFGLRAMTRFPYSRLNVTRYSLPALP